MNKDAIRFSASFYKHLSPRISNLPQILNQAQNNRSHRSHLFNFQSAPTMLLYFSFVSVFQPSQSHLYFLQSLLHLPHTLIKVFLFLGLWRAEYKVHDCSDAAGGTMHWWVDWFQAERFTYEFFILYPERLLSGDSHIFRHVRSEKLSTCTCQTCCKN